MGQQLYFDNYNPTGDVIVVAICIVMLILVSVSYVTKTKNFSIFITMIAYLVFAAMADYAHHEWFTYISDGNYSPVYAIRIVYHALLFSLLLLYVFYIIEMQHLEISKRIPVMFISTAVYAAVIIVDIVSTLNGSSFKLNKNGTAVSGLNVFLVGYILFIAIIVFLMVVFRDRIYKKAMFGFYGTMLVSFLILFYQGSQGQSSYTVASFLFPVIAMMYLVHSTPYDVELGTINVMAIKDMVRYNYEKKRELLYMSLYLPDFDSEGKLIPEALQKTIRKFAAEYFKKSVLFQINNGHVILFAPKKSNPDYENRLNKILNAFHDEYEKFKFDYKVVIGETIDEISRKNEYLRFIENIYRHMELNEVHIVDVDDVTVFNKYAYILEQLEDIYKKHDLRDERVLAYCQPVFNISNQRYDTAEALMRLKLPEIGMVYPDQFIPIAEEHGFIHVLTEIILQKTCDEIKRLIEDGYGVKRISINVSVLELRNAGFTKDIEKIIESSRIPDSKIAIEITESRSDSDFIAMKTMIEELKDKGIKFYLDDFGTGYSNMERIMELPFDIIKFDRSLVIACDTDEKSEKMVGSLANMFSELNYKILYEGVENELDEKRCINMSASYLQGYKYSKPIPIIELNRFFSKTASN